MEREWFDGGYVQYETFKYDEEAVLDIFSIIREFGHYGLDFILVLIQLLEYFQIVLLNYFILTQTIIS